MTRRLILCAFLAASVVAARASDTLEAASKWPDLVDSAKGRGIDYPATVALARRGDVAALRVLFLHTPHTDGSGADSHCAVLRQLLELLGDRKFSDPLRREPRSLRSKVTEAIDFDFGRPWQKRFPLTYALGIHDPSGFTRRYGIPYSLQRHESKAVTPAPALPAHQGLFDFRQNGFHFFPAEGAQRLALGITERTVL